MTIGAWLPLAAAALAAVLALASLAKARLTVARAAFLLGMSAFALENLFAGLTFGAEEAESILRLQRWRLLSLCVSSAAWLLFSLTYSRTNYRDFLKAWRWPLGAAFVAPALILALGWQRLYTAFVPASEAGVALLDLGVAGALLHILFLLCTVATLMNLERTFRSAVGTMRWRIKFMVLGLSLFLGLRIYTASLALLYGSSALPLQSLTAAAFLLAGLLLVRSLYRAFLVDTDVYVSHRALHFSLTALLAGVYLLAVGVLAHLVTRFGFLAGFPLSTLLVFTALVALAVLSVSDRFRQWSRRLVGRHFRRPQYDYREIWTRLTSRTAALTDVEAFCRETVAAVSELFEALSVTIWLLDEAGERLAFGQSTSLPAAQARGLANAGAADRELIEALRQAPGPVDLDAAEPGALGALRRYHPEYFPQKGGHRLAVPLVAGGSLLGVLVVGDRVNALPYTVEETDLLATLGAHIAAGLLGLRLGQRLVDAKQFEAFQTMSSFFVHDLKNTAATLSLMLQNLPRHFDDPAFREDALRAAAKTVARLNETVQRLSALRQQLEIHPAPADLNALVRSCLEELRPTCGRQIEACLGDVPPFAFDAEQIRKVLVNLLLNACEATSAGGIIRVATSRQNGWAVLEVADNGRGMPADFVAEKLFRPFQTRKKDGLGIGLYQSRMIVAAHRGTVEAQSVEGVGSTFRVRLPHSG